MADNNTNVSLNEWIATVTTNLPNLSKSQATVLACFSFGMVLAKCCAVTTVVIILAPLLRVKENTLRQRLREWYVNADKKKGDKRVSLDVESCFPFLLRWILSLWHSNQLALAMDATTLSDRFVVLAISVVYRGCAIPVSWTVLSGNKPHGWRQEWLSMLDTLKGSIPSEMLVIVLTDRGLYAPWLFRRIRRCAWHPFMRINAGGTFKPENYSYYRPLTSFAPQPGSCFSSRGVAFKTKGKQLPCTLQACWEEGTKEAWFILTSLPPSACHACWYGLRAWIEQGFRTFKRGFWQWQRSRMTDPCRTARLWLAIAVANLWLMSVGGESDETIPESTCLTLTSDLTKQANQSQSQLPSVSFCRRGWVKVVLALLCHDPLPQSKFIPEAWIDVLD